MATQILIGGEPYVPGQSLSLAQMAAISASIQLGNDTYSSAYSGTLNAQAYAQYVAQGGQLGFAAMLSATAQPQDSAAQIVVEAADARDEGAISQNPPVPTSPVTSIVGAETIANTVVTVANNSFAAQGFSIGGLASRFVGTNNRLLTSGLPANQSLSLSQSQATPPFSTVNNLLPGGVGANTILGNEFRASAASQPGQGAPNSDGIGTSAQDIIRFAFQSNTNQRIPTQPNVLDQFASYTYQLSWYLMTDSQYNDLIKSGNRNVGGWSLLMQSGGAPVQTTGATAANNNLPIRNQFFPLDYYMDDLEIHTLIPQGGTQMAHTATSIKFKVTEPNGVTLVSNLYSAVSALYGYDNTGDYDPAQNLLYKPGQAPISIQPPNYLQAMYCLVIRFYGYDAQGNLQAPIMGTNGSQQAIVQKIYPFQLVNITFTMAPGSNSRGIEYHVECVPRGQLAFAQARGTVPYNFQLSGNTVKDLLIGKPAQAGLVPKQDGRVTTTTPPGNASTTIATVITAEQQITQFGTFNAGNSLTYSDTPGIY